MARKTILIVDDEPEILDLIKKKLEANRFSCLTALEPAAALATARTSKPDLILLDLMLPNMSGLGVLRELKKDPDLSGIPVVVLTALGDAEIAEEAMNLGAAAYLTKSCKPQEIVAAVKTYA